MATIAGPRAATSPNSLKSPSAFLNGDSSSDSTPSDTMTSQSFRYKFVSTGRTHIPEWESPDAAIPLAATVAIQISWDTRVHEKLSSKWVDSIPPLRRVEAYDLMERLVSSLSKPAYIPYPTVEDPIIVALDLEHFPVREDRQTEVGVAVLDTAAIKGTLPGAYADYWIQAIRPRHLRVWETGTWITYAKNKATGERYWAGNKFHFGNSEWRQVPDIYREVEDTLRVKIGGKSHYGAPVMRPIILLSHRWSQQERYLSNLFVDQGHHLKSFRLADFGSISAVIDTESLITSNATPKVELSSALHTQGYTDLVRHNAGNDAMYTMMLFLRIATNAANANRMPPQYMVHDKPQAMLNRLVQQRLKYRTPNSDGRCSACGRLGHTDPHCVWLNCCVTCGKNGFCAHRPKPKDFIHSPAPPMGMRSTSLGMHHHPRPGFAVPQMRWGPMRPMPVPPAPVLLTSVSQPTLSAASSFTPEEYRLECLATSIKTARARNLPVAPLVQTQDLRADAPVFRPITYHPVPRRRSIPSAPSAPIPSFAITSVTPMPMPAPTSTPPAATTGKFAVFGMQNRAELQRQERDAVSAGAKHKVPNAKVKINRVDGIHPAFHEDTTETEDWWRYGHNACLRHLEVDHIIRLCPQRREEYGW